MPDREDEPLQQPKLYQENELFNLRLTKKREDIRKLLNEKKKQGVDVSDFVTDCIRRAEGLTQAPSSSFVDTAPTSLMNEQFLDTIVSRLMEEIERRGMMVSGSRGDPVEPEEVSEAKPNPALKDAVKNILDW